MELIKMHCGALGIVCLGAILEDSDGKGGSQVGFGVLVMLSLYLGAGDLGLTSCKFLKLSTWHLYFLTVLTLAWTTSPTSSLGRLPTLHHSRDSWVEMRFPSFRL